MNQMYSTAYNIVMLEIVLQ